MLLCNKQVREKFLQQLWISTLRRRSRSLSSLVKWPRRLPTITERYPWWGPSQTWPRTLSEVTTQTFCNRLDNSDQDWVVKTFCVPNKKIRDCCLISMNSFVIELPFRKEQFECSFQNCLFVVSNLLIKLFVCKKHASLLFVTKFLPHLGGSDAASARYIFTKISPLTRCQFHQCFTRAFFVQKFDAKNPGANT